MKYQAELTLAYEDFADFSDFTIPNNLPSFFEYVSFSLKENNGTVRYMLHIGDVISINTMELGGGFAIIQAILCHQKNDHRFAFIIVDWFEETNRTKLGCPLYRLRKTSNRRKMFSIGVVDTVNTIQFIHNCKENECIGGNHDFKNDLYIRNLYFFKAV